VRGDLFLVKFSTIIAEPIRYQEMGERKGWLVEV
jgi:hypothetical protein